MVHHCGTAVSMIDRFERQVVAVEIERAAPVTKEDILCRHLIGILQNDRRTPADQGHRRERLLVALCVRLLIENHRTVAGIQAAAIDPGGINVQRACANFMQCITA